MSAKSFVPDDPNAYLHMPVRLTIVCADEEGFRFRVYGGFMRAPYEAWCSLEDLKRVWMQDLPWTYDTPAGKVVVSNQDVIQLYKDVEHVKEAGE